MAVQDVHPRPTPVSDEQSEAYWLMRLGSIGAIVGAVLAGVGNVVHPITPRDDNEGVAHIIAQTDAWTLIHLVIIAGTLFMLSGLIGLRHALPTSGLSGALTRLGAHAAVIGTVIGVVTVILDGVGAKRLADEWAVAPASEHAIALRIVSANETINFALAGMFNATFAGVPFVLFGLAVARTNSFPRWLGWVAVAAGVSSIVAGVVQAITGRPTVASLVLTIIGPTIIAIWMLVIGVLLGRRARQVHSSAR